MPRQAWKRWPARQALCPGTMNNNTTHPIEVAILAAVVAVEMLVAVVAVALVVAGWRPAAAAQPPAAAAHQKATSGERQSTQPWAPPTPPELEALPVAHLRKLARSAGLPRCLTHRGRRDDLLMAMAVAW